MFAHPRALRPSSARPITANLTLILFTSRSVASLPSRARKRGGQSGTGVRKPSRQVTVSTEHDLLNQFPSNPQNGDGGVGTEVKGHQHQRQRQKNQRASPLKTPERPTSTASSLRTNLGAGMGAGSQESDLFVSPRAVPHDSKSILDKVFKDRGPNNTVARRTHVLGLKDRPYVLAFNEEGKKMTAVPVVTDPTQIHGSPSFLVQHAYALRFLQSTPVAHNCKFFTAYYLPPWHFIALARKSRPAMVSTFSLGAEFNGGADLDVDLPTELRVQKKQQQKQQQQAQGKSRNPMHYAFSRKHITQRTRNALWTAFQANRESVDGLYLFKSHNYPNDMEALQKEADALVSKAARLAKGGMPWAEEFNRRIKWPGIDHMCRKRLVPPLPRVPVGTGLDWRKA